MVDPKSILFSTPTLNDALPAYAATRVPGQKLYDTHEDNWRQLEAVSSTHAGEIDQELAAVRKIFETASVKLDEKHPEQRAFRSVHVRKLIREPVAPGLRLSELVALADHPADFSGFTLSGSPPAAGGYALRLGAIVIFGQTDGERVLNLCFDIEGPPRLPAERAKKLVALLEKHHLLVIDWPSATIVALRTELVPFLTRSN